VNLLSAEKISKSYSEKILFNQISLGINEGEKIGVIGINGTGKSTLLKVLAGSEYPDEGNIIKANGLQIEYLPQNPIFDDNTSVLEQVFKGTSPVMLLLREYEDTRLKFEHSPDNIHLQSRFVALTQRMESLQAWSAESEAKAILTKLGIFDYNAKVNTLSGGQKKRVAMAAALITPADLLILDEPTNHIDNTTVDWLEKYLNSRKGALLMVTHDRYFLDRVSNRIVELDNGRLFSYQANYSKFLEMKAEREVLEQASERKRQNLYRHELEWIRQGAQARSTKQKSRIERFEKLKEEQPPQTYENIEIRAGSTRLGRKTIELEHVAKSFTVKKIINDFSYILQKNDRIGIIGPNGSGKSTLLNIIAGRLEPDMGTVVKGETVKIGFFAQENSEMEESMRVIEYIRDEAEYLTTPEGVVSASQMLETFLFPPSVQWTPLSKLSGGEKRRLYLLRVLISAPNILLLDEPTNDLDVLTLTILENYLDTFPGAVITVSHDRYFLDRVTEKTFLLEGNGEIERFEGNYSYYSEAIQQKGEAMKAAISKPATAKSTGNTGNTANKLTSDNSAESAKLSASDNHAVKKERPLKFTYKEQKEYEQIDSLIASLENKINETNELINTSATDFTLLQDLLTVKQQLEDQLDEAMERWVYLNELADVISNQQKKV